MIYESLFFLSLFFACRSSGKWLAKNERSKIGYVDLANIEFDAESVKLLMNINPLEAIAADGASVPSGSRE